MYAMKVTHDHKEQCLTHNYSGSFVGFFDRGAVIMKLIFWRNSAKPKKQKDGKEKSRKTKDRNNRISEKHKIGMTRVRSDTESEQHIPERNVIRGDREKRAVL